MTKHLTKTYWIGFCVVMALLTMAPLVLPEFWRRFLTEILIWGLLAMSSDLLIGYTGMISFGHSAFFGLGMYGAAAARLIVSPPNLWLAIGLGHQVHHLLLIYHTPPGQHVEEVIRPQFSHVIRASHSLIKFGLHPFQLEGK